MTRKFFRFSRMRLRQGQLYHRDGETATAVLSSSSAVSTTAHSSAVEGLSDGPSMDDELEKIVTVPSTQKAANKTKKIKSLSESPVAVDLRPKEHPPSLAVLLELQSSIDFLQTKLQQSESHVKALQAQNEKLKSFLENFLGAEDKLENLNEEDDEQEDDDEEEEEDPEQEDEEEATGIFQVMRLQWPSFGTANPTGPPGSNRSVKEEEKDVPPDDATTKQSVVFTPFSKEDAEERVKNHYQKQLDELLQEKTTMQEEIKQLKTQNQVQIQTMASLEHQLTTDRQRHQSFFEKDNHARIARANSKKQETIRPSTSRVSKSTSTRSKKSKPYWQQLEEQNPAAVPKDRPRIPTPPKTTTAASTRSHRHRSSNASRKSSKSKSKRTSKRKEREGRWYQGPDAIAFERSWGDDEIVAQARATKQFLL